MKLTPEQINALIAYVDAAARYEAVLATEEDYGGGHERDMARETERALREALGEKREPRG